MKVCRRETFNSAHRLHNPTWSDEKNANVFGKCNNPNYHGHNYVLETWIIGDINPETGYVMDLKIRRELIKKEVIERFDHKNLNLDCEEFKDLNPTAEHIAKVIYQLISPHLPPHLSLSIKLWETENNIVEYSGE